MEAGPRNHEETAVDEVERTGDPAAFDAHTDPDGHAGGPADAVAPGDHEPDLDSEADLDDELLDDPEGNDEDDAPRDADGTDVEPQELRPQRKLRVWQLAPIVVLSALGSLMFAFPLAFEPGGGTGAVVSMLGLLICGCAAGWGVMAARRVGLSWPGLPAPDSGERPDWRIVALYAVVVGTVVVLAVWRVARLR
jgi:hypothetical protein